MIYIPNEKLKLMSIETLIYLMESNDLYSIYILNQGKMEYYVNGLINIISNNFGDQLHRSSSYLISLWYKHTKNDLFKRYTNIIFNACSQYNNVSCYAVHLTNI
mmetsp:Transcript_54426/g.66795  ORF Transcript_54426/g.66795 Transcript_54426/m.66795 type:complete len:104 (+) Transcript_54426:3-314(+)